MSGETLPATLALPAHHVTRDVHADASRRGVARVRDLLARFGHTTNRFCYIKAEAGDQITYTSHAAT